ncbi:MAG: hypothetical protein KC414_07415, partial [Romboutsia sp.]|nr:hypothetical protein [Romboutsia sp.]
LKTSVPISPLMAFKNKVSNENLYIFIDDELNFLYEFQDSYFKLVLCDHNIKPVSIYNIPWSQIIYVHQNLQMYSVSNGEKEA